MNNHSDTGDYCQAIAARCDLQPTGSNMLMGAIDCKVTSDSLVPNHEALIILGPTYENLPYFSWAGWPQNGMIGLETVYDFEWVFVDPKANFSAFSGVEEVVEEIEELAERLITW